MKKILILFIIFISLYGCSNNEDIKVEAKFKTFTADAKTITLNQDQALKIYKIFKATKLDNETYPYECCLGSYEFNVNGELEMFTVISEDVITDNSKTYKIDDIALYVETAKLYYDLEDKPLITLNDIKSLISEKGYDLNYDDFKDYLHFDVGSGLKIYHFPIDTNYSLMISDFNDNIKPDYIELYNDSHEKIDIRTDNIENFIQ